MSVVQEIYKKNTNISDLELAEEVIKYPELEPLDLWLLPQYPFDVWRRKYDYPRLLESIRRRKPDFKEWMLDQGITDEHLLSGYLSDFFENKPLSTNLNKHLVRVFWEGKADLQSWHAFDEKKDYEQNTPGVKYEYVKSYISYYDWLWTKKGSRFSFMNHLDRFFPNTETEAVFVNVDVRLLKMGAMEPPTNVLGIMLRGKFLEFVNISGLKLHGKIYFGDMGNLEFNHSTVDNLKCSELNMHNLHFENCSVQNISINNSNISGWLFATTYVTGNITDSKLSNFRIFGGLFNPTFANSEADDFSVVHENVIHDDAFEKTYRTLSKVASESGNQKDASEFKIKELDFIKNKKQGFEKFFMNLNKIYWGYGQKPFQLIRISLTVILALGIFYSFFPCYFSNPDLKSENYFNVLYNSLYFSVVTFTTLGYGDLSPMGFLKFFAALEALFGALTLGFLVAGLTKNS